MTKPRKRYITAKQLRRVGACIAQRHLFQSLFGKDGRVEVNERNLTALYTAFDLMWARTYILTNKQRERWNFEMEALTRANFTESFKVIEAMPKGAARDQLFETIWAAEKLDRRRRHASAFARAYNSPKE